MTPYERGNGMAYKAKEQWLAVEDFAGRCRVSKETIWRWHRDDPTFPRAVKLGPGATRWRLDEIEAWEKSRAVAA
jgi:predicted DNA-binding transcriptional regulator AlpA